jgi:hypothetical protein
MSYSYMIGNFKILHIREQSLRAADIVSPGGANHPD